MAHRGLSAAYPENTVLAMQAALEAGARYVEFDVQLTKDLVPVVIHDATLLRTTGKVGDVRQLNSADLVEYNAGFSKKFGDQFNGDEVAIPTLEDMVALMLHNPKLTCFVELKRASIAIFGASKFVDTVLQYLQPVLKQCVIISFDQHILQLIKDKAQVRVGWVFDRWQEQWRNVAQRLQVDYLFVDIDCIPSVDALTPGDWKWVIYEVDAPDVAQFWLQNGAHMIETNNVESLLQAHPS